MSQEEQKSISEDLLNFNYLLLYYYVARIDYHISRYEEMQAMIMDGNCQF